MKLLNTLLDRLRELGESTDDAAYVVMEHWVLEVREHSFIQSVLERSVQEFAGYGNVQERLLNSLGQLLRFGGNEAESFAVDLWRAYIFHLEDASEGLWNRYPDLQRNVAIETGQYLPNTWGEWVLFIQHFMGLVETYLIDSNPVFESLLVSEDIADLLEAAPAKPGLASVPDLGVYFEPDHHFDAAVTLITYLNICAERIGRIDPRGYPRSIHTSVPISDIYIPLRLASFAAVRKPGHLVRYQTATYENPALYDFRNPLHPEEVEKEHNVTVQDALREHALVLLLGEEGSGKTTLLRHLALEHARILLDNEASGLDIQTHIDGTSRIRLARPLPVYIDLAEFIEGRLPDEDLHGYLLRHVGDLTSDDSTGRMIATLLSSGQCLVLLDGLDQVATDDQRRLLVSQIAHAAPEWRAQGNRVVVTSRLDGYAALPLPAEFGRFLIKSFDRGQVGAFLIKWKLTLSRIQRPLMSDDDALRQAQSETLALVRQITSNAQLYRIASNPLTLRMLTSVRTTGSLPARRIAIYQLVIDTLIREWKLPQQARSRPAVLEQDVVPLLGELAYWLQSSRPSGTVGEQELSEILRNILGELHPEYSPEHCTKAIAQFLGQIRQYPGVFIEVAPQKYGFIYQAIQEYFAARRIVSSHRTASERLRAHLHNPRWEPILTSAISFVALTSREDASDLIETSVLARGSQAARLGYAPSLFEELLHRDLFQAARLLGEGIEVRPDVAHYVMHRLMELWLLGERDQAGRFNYIFDEARRHLIHMEGTSASQVAHQIALDNLTAHHSEHRQAYAVDAATFWHSHLEQTREALIGHSKDAPPLVRRAIADALGRVPSLSKEAYVLLLTLTRDADEQVSEASQRTLEGATPIPYEALTMWIEFLHSGSQAKRRLSLRVLQQIGTLPPLVIGELLQLVSDEDPSIRQGAIDVLAGVSHLPDNALTAICRTIADMNTGVRVAAISALNRPVDLPQEVINQLIAWSRDADVAVRRAAIAALGTANNASNEVLQALIECLDDPSDSIREMVLDPLARKGKENDKVIHMLMHTVSDPRYSVRKALAHALRHFRVPVEDVRQALQVLLSDRDIIVREAALETIATLLEPGDEIIDYLISLAPLQEHGMGARAVEAMSGLRGLPERALLTLVQALPIHWQPLGDRIVACLRGHAPLPPNVMNEVMDLAVLHNVGSTQLSKYPAGLRSLALEILSLAQDETPAVLQILLQAATEAQNTEVQIAAIRGLANIRRDWPGIKETLFKLMRHPRPEIRFAAGVTLGKLVQYLPDPPLDGPEIVGLTHTLINLLKEAPARASWESDTDIQNDLLIILSGVVSRVRPTPPLLTAGSENADRYLDK